MRAITTSDVARRIGKTEQHTRRLLKSLADRGLAQRIGRRRGWCLTFQGALLLGLTPVQWIGEAADHVGEECDARVVSPNPPESARKAPCSTQST
jgi:DNA-binding IclR family transcriptional regulator